MTRATPATVSYKISEVSPRTVRDHRALVQRVLCSREMAKCTRVSDFLTYVCQRAFEDPHGNIHEQEIGHQVFNRPADYDTRDDNVVRVTASNTRKKLEEYFASDGILEQIVLEIPRGRYTPVFRERDPADSQNRALSELLAQEKLATYRRMIFALAACASLLLAFGVWCGVALRRERRAERTALIANPALNALWSQLLVSTGHTDIIVTDSSLSLFNSLLDHPITLGEYLNSDQWTAAAGLSVNPDLKAFAQFAARLGLTSICSVKTAYRIALLASQDRGRISILRPRDFNMTQMKFDNVVLLGSSRANPWEDLIDPQLDFQFRFDQKSQFSYFENRDPRPGEQKIYQAKPNLSYCRVAFVPNLGGTGNVLAIAGTEIEGTEGCGEFVTSERSVADLLARAGLRKGGRMPHFEVLLKGASIGGETTHLSIVDFHLIQPVGHISRP